MTQYSQDHSDNLIEQIEIFSNDHIAKEKKLNEKNLKLVFPQLHLPPIIEKRLQEISNYPLSEELFSILLLTFQNFSECYSLLEKSYEQLVAKESVIRALAAKEKKLVRKNTPLLKRFFSPKLGHLWQHVAMDMMIPASYRQLKEVKNPPSITIVTPSFNQKDYIGRTILSVLDQHYPNLEYIVQDGASKDGSIEEIKKFADALTRWDSRKDNGQAHAINMGFEGTHGEIMAYLNSDDLLLPGTLNYVAWFFENNPDVDVVYGHRILINESDHQIGRWILPPHDEKVLKWIDFIPQETLFWRRNLWNKVGGKMDESFRFALDWDLLLRFQAVGAKMVRLPRFLGAFRVHQNQKTSANIASIGMEEMRLLRRQYLGYVPFSSEIKSHVRTYIMKHIICDKLYSLGLFNY